MARRCKHCGHREETWVEHESHGRGHLFEDHGFLKVCLQKEPNVVRNYTGHEGRWTIVDDARTWRIAEVASVMYEADRQLLHLFGERARANMLWENLKPEQRRAWAERGPPKSNKMRQNVRAKLYAAIRRVLEDELCS